MAADQAAKLMIFYFVGFTLGRLISGILATRLSCWKIIRMAMVVLGMAMILLLLPLPGFTIAIALFLVGMGNSPIFPNFTYLTPQNFGADISQSMIGTQMAASNTGFLVSPLLCGLLGQLLGMGIFPLFLCLLYGGVILGATQIQKIMKSSGKDIR